MRNRRNRLLAFGALVVLVLGGGLLLVAWLNRPGTVAWVNYERIRPGMSVEQVELLLGRPGAEIGERELPGVVDHEVPLDHPKRVKPVISGERYLKWNERENDRTVIVSLKDGVVAEKWFWELSL